MAKAGRAVPFPHNGPLAALSGVTAISATDVWAVGTVHTKYLKHFITDTVALRWNGKVWQRMPPPGGGSLLAVTGSEKNIWAVGGWNTRDSGDGQNRTLIVHWIGHWKYFSGHTRSSKSIQQPLTGIAMLPGNEGWAVVGRERALAAEPDPDRALQPRRLVAGQKHQPGERRPVRRRSSGFTNGRLGGRHVFPRQLEENTRAAGWWSTTEAEDSSLDGSKQNRDLIQQIQAAQNQPGIHRLTGHSAGPVFRMTPEQGGQNQPGGRYAHLRRAAGRRLSRRP